MKVNKALKSQDILSQVEAELKAPGAGLPLMQKLMLKFYLGPVVAKRTSWEESKKTFEVFTAKILKATSRLSDDELIERILIPPQLGLEDSSRFWSIAMTLEHLALSGNYTAAIIEELSQGIIPSQEVTFSKIMPSGKLSATEALEMFKTFSFDRQEQMERNILEQDSPLRIKHPWFGPLNAEQWYWVMASHHVMHYKQIKEIRKRLELL